MKQQLRKKDEPVFNRIWESIFSQDEVVLSDAEKAIKERWEFSWKLLCAMHHNRNIVAALKQSFDVSERQAYADLANAIKLYSDPRLASKKAKHVIAEEWIVKGLKKAWENDDLDNYNRLLRRYNALNGLEDQTAPLEPRPPITVVFTNNPDALLKQAEDLMQGTQDTQDIDHEDLEP